MRLPVILLLVLTLVSQAAENVRTIQLRTLCFQHVNGLKEVLLVTGKKGARQQFPVKLFTSAYSDEIEAKVTDEQLLFAVPVDDPKDGEEPFRIIAEARLAKGSRQLAIFFPSKDDDSPYRVQVLDESEQAFPMGSTLIYNLTQTTGRFTIGEHGKEIKSGKTGLVPLPTKVNKLNQCTVRVFLLDDQEAWKTVSSTVWKASKEMRGLALAYIHPKTGQPTVNCFQETPPWRLPQLE
jgi:hypothetical protein